MQGKVALITGSSRGIGHFMAVELAKAGADIVVAARSEQEPDPRLPGTIHSVAAEISALGRRALPVRMDLTKDEEVEQGVQQAIAEFGRIDVLINNAGIMAPAPLVDLPMKRWDLVMRVNVRGAVVATKAVLPHMMERKSGTIIFISSVAAEMSGAGNISYAVSKLSLEKIAQGLAEEVRDDGISVFGLAPRSLVITPGNSFVRGDARPEGIAIEPPEQMGQAAIYLCSDDAKQYSGHTFYSDAAAARRGEPVR
ncbi:MAG TPA: SDR family NAD(P)-dependent oxidoreductase [Dehalococcoidia bacterium]|nr:SDR family NAD(P)-dependent oxidoreductase [Dehalococcoidia bacterium]